MLACVKLTVLFLDDIRGREPSGLELLSDQHRVHSKHSPGGHLCMDTATSLRTMGGVGGILIYVN